MQMIQSFRGVTSAFRVLIGTSLVMLLAASAPCDEPAAEETALLPQKEKFHLYLLIGQSNMVGRDKPQPEDKQVHPRSRSILASSCSTKTYRGRRPLTHYRTKTAAAKLASGPA